MNASQLINQTSGKTEYYTPALIVEASRATMGGIDFDPASSEQANQIVKAKTFLTAADDGLSRVWEGRVWLNHPFGREDNAWWINALVAHYEGGLIEQACCITFASTSEAWFSFLFNYPMCFLRPRTNYLGADGKPIVGVTKGSVVTYLGLNVRAFRQNFCNLGAIMLPAYMVSEWTQN